MPQSLEEKKECGATAMSTTRTDVNGTVQTMKALVFHPNNNSNGPSIISLQSMPRPTIQEPTDVVIRVHKTTICGTDLHIWANNVPSVQESLQSSETDTVVVSTDNDPSESTKTTVPGRILGHEGIGHVVQVGHAVQNFGIGDRVLVSCITTCGNCPACQRQQYAFCKLGGWQLGNTIHGMQAEYCRIPQADTTCHALPCSVPTMDGPWEDPYVMVSDILPTGYEIGLRGTNTFISPESSVAFVGMGPVGLAALLSLVASDKKRTTTSNCDSKNQRRIFAIDVNQHRLEQAKAMGATDIIDNTKGDAVEQILQLTNNVGVDFCVECIGLPIGWEICQDVVSMGGQISILGVHGRSSVIKLEKLWQHNVSIHTGMVHCSTIPDFLEWIEQGHLDARPLISHRFALSDIERAYDHFKNADTTHSLKVIIKNDFGE